MAMLRAMTYGYRRKPIGRLQGSIRKKGYTRREQRSLLCCPECGKPLRAMNVNTNAANRVGGRYKCLFFCTVACGYERYSKESIIATVKKLEKENGENRIT